MFAALENVNDSKDVSGARETLKILSKPQL